MWKVCMKPHKKFKNIEEIFPTQQKDVSAIVEALDDYGKVKKIIIFGSSVTSGCNPWSDIDVFIEFYNDGKRSEIYNYMPRFDSVALDIWDNTTVDDDLMEEIKSTGVVVYEK